MIRKNLVRPLAIQTIFIVAFLVSGCAKDALNLDRKNSLVVPTALDGQKLHGASNDERNQTTSKELEPALKEFVSPRPAAKSSESGSVLKNSAY